MTCRQLGGPCDTPISGNDPEELKENAKKHMHETLHEETIEMMRKLSEDPEAAKAWNDDLKEKFEAQPED